MGWRTPPKCDVLKHDALNSKASIEIESASMNERRIHIDWDRLKLQLKEAALTLPNFFKNPVQGMRSLPDWQWSEILILQAIFVISCSTLANLLQRDLLGLITGIFISPLTALVFSTVGTAFFFYLFKFASHRDLSFRLIYMHLLFASIPLMVVTVIAHLLPPAMIIGAIASAALLYIGFVANFKLPEKHVRNVIAALLAIYTVYWLLVLINNTRSHKSMRLRATPESLDILERELKSN